jgi:hypothetical protein
MGGLSVPGNVLAAARAHFARVPCLRGLRWVIRTPMLVQGGGWFFPYAVERKKPNDRPPPSFAFALDFIVAHDGSIHDVAQWEGHLIQPPLGDAGTPA